MEHYLAAVFNKLEMLIDQVAGGGTDRVLDLYHNHWLHSGAVVTVRPSTGLHCDTFQAHVVGVDEYGFLRVVRRDRDGASPLTVHPDGNSFDMLNGLVVPKTDRE